MILATTTLFLLINSVRNQPLKYSPELENIAMQRCISMKEFSHQEYLTIYSKKIHNLGYKYSGENLGMDFIDDKLLFTALQNSPTHKANNQSKNFQNIGIAKCKNLTVMLYSGN